MWPGMLKGVRLACSWPIFLVRRLLWANTKDMDNFTREKARRRDIVLKRGGEPVWLGIRSGDNYLSKEDIEMLTRGTPKPLSKRLKEEGDISVAIDLSYESRGMLSRLFLFHPETVIIAITQSRAGEIENVELGGSNGGYLRQLIAALKDFDKARGSTVVPQGAQDAFPRDLGPGGRRIFWKVFPFLPATRPRRFTYAVDGTILEMNLVRTAKSFQVRIHSALKRYDELSLKKRG